jgi:GT2 family glycosyltransferase
MRKADLLLWCGNDILLRPNSVDHMVKAITETDYEMFCGNEVLNKEVLSTNENAIAEFRFKFSFDEKKYDDLAYSHGGLNHSCLIRKKSVFDKVGYYDVNFYPAYFEDNDYHYRMRMKGYDIKDIPGCKVKHENSGTMKAYNETELKMHHQRFREARSRYLIKWGGEPAHEV